MAPGTVTAFFPGAMVPPPHSHTDNEECVYVLEGTLRYAVDGEVRDLGPGDWMSTPRGSVHAFSNTADRTARALIMLTPDIGARYFEDVAEVVNAGGPPDKAKLLQVMGRYGLVPAPPPMARNSFDVPGMRTMPSRSFDTAPSHLRPR